MKQADGFVPCMFASSVSRAASHGTTLNNSQPAGHAAQRSKITKDRR
jgi:hypothetical protein